jgi:hypothetical protein
VPRTLATEQAVTYAFLAVILAQAAHSIEEYIFRLSDVLAPARYIASLFSNDPRIGFAVANVVLVLAGLWCWLGALRGRPWAVPAAWFWALLETVNGIGHLALAVWRGGYFPGAWTTPLLLTTALYLMRRLAMQRESPQP